MRIGINGSSLVAAGRPVGELVAHAAQAEADGFATWWIAQLGAPDALTALAVIGQATSTIELGTAVIATWPRHPLMLAAQALTTAQLCPDRLVVGIGLAHKPTVEATFRIPFARPAQHMDEYLSILLPAMAHQPVDVTGATWSANAAGIGGPADVPAPSVMLAAMGPRMLDLAGSRTDGTILWLSGPRTIATRLAPALGAAAERAGRPAPRVVASVPVCVTDDPDRVRGLVAAILADYNDLPSYREVMDVEGVDGPEGVSLIGDEDTVRAGLAAFADAGTTDFSALEFVTNDDETVRTRTLLQSVAAEG
ncbi:MAG: TIGR03564 family F420-dependent LLM class oxidoreductase [Acidimicrobiales bacterium]|nr:TIGR03564 family F420-dependent LLM class oxidoreductase [Acidimicrobiales bacterium]